MKKLNLNKMKIYKVLISSIIFGLILGLTSIATATPPSGYTYNPKCDLGYDWFNSSPKGLTNKANGDCPWGLEYASFNAFRDSQYLKSGDKANQFEFAWVRTKESNQFYKNKARYGWNNSTTLSENESAEAMFYVHNSGRPDCNFPDGSSQLKDNGCIRSTIAKNAKIKLTGFTEDGAYLISTGIQTNSTRTHNFNATLSASNTTPSSLSDGFNILTNSKKIIKVPKNSPAVIRYCEKLGDAQPSGNRECEKRGSKTVTMEDLSNGVNLNFGFNNNSNGFYASEGYVLNIYALFTQDDAPEEQIVCEGINSQRIAGQASATSQTYRIEFSPNEREFHNKIQVSGATHTTSYATIRNHTDVKLTNLTKDSKVTITSRGSSSACSTTLTFPDIPETGGECKDLQIIKGTQTENSLEFEINATPSRFENLANVNSTNGTLQKVSSTKYRVTNLDQQTVITANIASSYAGSENCSDSLEFTPEPPEKLECESISLNTNQYNYQNNPRPTFNITDKKPAELKAEFEWSVIGKNGETLQRATNISGNFRPNSPLTGNEKIQVKVKDSNNANCTAEATSELPPIEEVCEDLEIVRILNPQLKRSIPNNGQPAIFELEGGSYEGKITFKAEGEPGKTIFITNDQRASGEITVDIDETVIILNTGLTNTVRVFAQEQNQYTKNCFLTLKADSDDEGDKLTEIDKTVNKSIATDGDILTYTIKYTISPVFGNSQFQDALEGFDTAVLKDNIKTIDVYQDKSINPLKSENSKLTVLDLKIDGRLRDSSGDLFNLNEGLTIEDLTKKAGNTYTISYTARLEADIIQDCQTITDSCGFEFPNKAYDNFGNEDYATVLATCPFIVSRSFGDVFLEEEFEGTVDIARCTNKRNTEGPVFTPKPKTPQELVSSGTGALSAPSHRICRESIKANPNLSGRELEGYQNPLENFSSSVCEVSLFTSSSWTSEDIERNLRSNASRFNNVTNLNNTDSLTQLNQSALTTYDNLNPNSDTKVYRKTNGNLTIGGDSPISINDGAAKTIIIEGHDLIINQNINYNRGNSVFPSQIAFIVIGGDVVVSPEVTQLAGVIVAIPDTNGEGGFIKRSSKTNKLLTIRGSIFGDSGPLFAGTSNPGDLLADQGAVTVIYDSGIILNTPPGLQSIIQFNQYQTVR
jgi:hypothetical protein